MKYIKLFEDIDFDDIVEEEFDDNIKNIEEFRELNYYEQLVGRKCIIKNTSRYYRQNPVDYYGERIQGTIKRIKHEYFNHKTYDNIKDHIFRVEWKEENYSNSYRIEDIELVG